MIIKIKSVNLANLKIMIGKFEEAILLYTRAIKIDENIENIHISGCKLK